MRVLYPSNFAKLTLSFRALANARRLSASVIVCTSLKGFFLVVGVAGILSWSSLVLFVILVADCILDVGVFYCFLDHFAPAWQFSVWCLFIDVFSLYSSVCFCSGLLCSPCWWWNRYLLFGPFYPCGVFFLLFLVLCMFCFCLFDSSCCSLFYFVPASFLCVVY